MEFYNWQVSDFSPSLNQLCRSFWTSVIIDIHVEGF